MTAPAGARPGRAAVVGSPEVLAAAEAALTPAEREAFARYTFPKRRMDWLLGRWASKLAAADACGCAPDAVGVAYAEKNRPVLVADLPSLAGWHLTLTHGHGRAAAIVAPGPVGVDLEAMREVPGNGWRFFLSEPERAKVLAGEFGPHGEIVYWALKEAAYKALGGETDAMPGLATTIRPDGTATVVTLGVEVALRWAVKGGFCLAIGVPAPAPAWLADLDPADLLH